ncbi:MAG: FAD-dependent oxidoreductase [Eubacteriales bacterium]|nr:FAD-dependent oxidoreductase [Eubacteriales bacterium]
MTILPDEGKLMTQREYDIIVYGAGPSALAAASEAVLMGASVLWLCETPWLGGAFTCGYANRGGHFTRHPLFDELSALFLSAWGYTYYEPYQAERVLAAEAQRMEIATRGNVRLLSVRTDDTRLRSIKICSDAGLEKLRAWAFIDASDDALLSRRAGAAPLRPQGGWYTLRARVGGMDTRMAAIYSQSTFFDLSEPFEREVLPGHTPLRRLLPSVTPLPRGNTAMLQACAVHVSDDEPLDNWALRRSLTDQLDDALRFLRNRAAGWQGLYLIDCAPSPVRLNPCHIVGRAVRRDAFCRSDEVACCTVDEVAHSLSPQCLISLPYDNLLLCGGALSVGAQAADAYETLAGHIAAGQAAGALANESLVYDGEAPKCLELPMP